MWVFVLCGEEKLNIEFGATRLKRHRTPQRATQHTFEVSTVHASTSDFRFNYKQVSYNDPLFWLLALFRTRAATQPRFWRLEWGIIFADLFVINPRVSQSVPENAFSARWESIIFDSHRHLEGKSKYFVIVGFSHQQMFNSVMSYLL